MPVNIFTYLVLHNIRSVQNVGAIFRTADAAGVEKIYLVGYTPAPLDRFGRPRADFTKTSLGAEKYVSWEKIISPAKLLQKLNREKVGIVCLEQAKGAVDYKKYKPKQSLALWVGNEVEGISKTILQKADNILFIPMRGRKESLNVSTAVGIALFRILNV